MMEFGLFITLFAIGAYYILETYVPGIFGRSYEEIKGVSLGMVYLPGAVLSFFWNLGAAALGLPQQIANAIMGQ